MVLDLNKILIFGKSDGTLSSQPQRQLFSLCDGIISGQGDGPLNPIPLPLGIIVFSNNSNLCDLVLVTLMNFDFKKIPLIKAANHSLDLTKFSVSYNGLALNLKSLRQHAIPTLPPPGWTNLLQS